MSEGNFECKVSGKRESANGIFLTLQIQPDDYDADLATMRVGSRLVLGWVEVVNTDVEPITISELGQAGKLTALPTPPKEDANGLGSASKKFHELPLSQQAAIRCGDVLFQEHLGVETAEAAADVVRSRCNIKSRSELDDARMDWPRHYWTNTEAKYQSWLTDRKFAEAKR